MMARVSAGAERSGWHVAAAATMEPFVVLDVDGVLHPLSEKGLPVNAAFEDLSKRADEDQEDDGLCVFPAVAGESQQHKLRTDRRLQSIVRVPVRPRPLPGALTHDTPTDNSGEFEPHCMAELARAVAETGAQIVLSTTWRETPPQRRAVDRKLQEFGIPASVEATPRLSVLRGGRASEILKWAAAQPAGTRWVALDDIDLGQKPVPGTGRSVVDGTLLPENFVHVDARTGLTAGDADRLIALLEPAAAAAVKGTAAADNT